MVTEKKLRLGIVGLGKMGVRHLEAARAVGMEVCGAADVDISTLKSVNRDYGLEEAELFVDASEMIKKIKLDCIVIATTAPTHEEFVLAAAAAGIKYILCEKPMAISLKQAEQMVRACDKAGARLAINHQMRFMPQYTRVKELINSEKLGPLSSIIVAGSNFGLAMNASHYFEMFRYISGETINRIQAWFDVDQLANPRGPQFEDRSGRLLAKSKSGLTLYIDFASTAGWGLQVIYICRYGQIIVDELNSVMKVSAREGEFREFPTTRYGLPSTIEEFEIEPLDAVASTISVWEALLLNKNFPDAQAGKHALACLVAAHVSDGSGGQVISVDESVLPCNRLFKWA